MLSSCQLEPTLFSYKKLDPDTEKRNIVDQIIDYIITGNQEGFKIFNEAKREFNRKSRSQIQKDDSNSLDKDSAFGSFMSTWIAFEYLLSEIAKKKGLNTRLSPVFNSRILNDMNFLSKKTIYDLDSIRRLRNEIVHGKRVPEKETLNSAVSNLENLIRQIRDEVDEQYKTLVDYVIEKFNLNI